MSVVAFTAGSLGDIIAISQILFDIIRALSGTCSPSEAETSLLKRLNSLHFTLDAAKSVLQECDASVGVGASAVRYGIHVELESCHRLLRDFERKLTHTRSSLRWTSISTVWNAVAWARRGEAEVEEIRSAISRHETQLSILFGMLNTSYAQTTCREIQKLSNSVEAPSARIQVKSLYITNPTGKVFTITIDHVFSPEQLHDLIVSYMKNSCGYEHVLQRLYTLVDKEDNEVTVNPRAMQHGTMLEMSMIEYGTVESYVSALVTCPACQRTTTAELGHWETCYFCSTRFRSVKASDSGAHRVISSDADRRHFRRLHLILARTTYSWGGSLVRKGQPKPSW